MDFARVNFQRRVTTRRHRYFYNPIEGTPFSLGLAIPDGYGMYELMAEQEIKRSEKNGKSSGMGEMEHVCIVTFYSYGSL